MQLSIHLFIHLLISFMIHPFSQLSVYSFIHSFIQLINLSFIHSFINSLTFADKASQQDASIAKRLQRK